MEQPLDFDADEKAADDTPVPFILKGQLLHVHPFQAGLLIAFSKLLVAGDDAEIVDRLPDGHPEKQEANQEMARRLAGLAEAIDEIIVKEDRRRWRKVVCKLRDDDLSRVANKLIEAITNRPTEGPSPSPPSLDANGAGSATGSTVPIL